MLPSAPPVWRLAAESDGDLGLSRPGRHVCRSKLAKQQHLTKPDAKERRHRQLGHARYSITKWALWLARRDSAESTFHHSPLFEHARHRNASLEWQCHASNKPKAKHIRIFDSPRFGARVLRQRDSTPMSAARAYRLTCLNLARDDLSDIETTRFRATAFTAPAPARRSHSHPGRSEEFLIRKLPQPLRERGKRVPLVHAAPLP